MKKLLKRVFCVLAAALMLVPFIKTEAFALEAESPYIYEHSSEMPYWHRSPHRYSYTGGSDHIAAMYLIEDGAEELPTYCCHLLVNVVPGTKYKRLNLEDADYYSDEAAGHIRGILENGYWPGRGDLAELESACGAENLTAAEALLATQCAIWTFANTNELTEIYSGTRNVSVISDIKDTAGVDPHEGGKTSLAFDEKVNANVKAVYDHLITKTSTAPESVIWNFEHENAVLKIDSSPEVCNIVALFKMSGSAAETEGLVFSARLVSDGAVLAEAERPLAELQPEGEFYSVMFKEIPTAKLGGAPKVLLSVAGSQKVSEGVYFYEPEGGTESAQCFVGFGSGETPVFCQTEIPVVKNEFSAKVYKYDEDAETEGEGIAVGEKTFCAVPGAEFELYVKIGDGDPFKFPGSDTKTTDEKGDILWAGLLAEDNIEYFCKEVSAPEGYLAPSGELIPLLRETFVPNSREKKPPEGPEEPGPSETPENTETPPKHSETEIIKIGGDEKDPPAPDTGAPVFVGALPVCMAAALTALKKIINR